MTTFIFDQLFDYTKFPVDIIGIIENYAIDFSICSNCKERKKKQTIYTCGHSPVCIECMTAYVDHECLEECGLDRTKFIKCSYCNTTNYNISYEVDIPEPTAYELFEEEFYKLEEIKKKDLLSIKKEKWKKFQFLI